MNCYSAKQEGNTWYDILSNMMEFFSKEKTSQKQKDFYQTLKQVYKLTTLQKELKSIDKNIEMLEEQMIHFTLPNQIGFEKKLVDIQSHFNFYKEDPMAIFFDTGPLIFLCNRYQQITGGDFDEFVEIYFTKKREKNREIEEDRELLEKKFPLYLKEESKIIFLCLKHVFEDYDKINGTTTFSQFKLVIKVFFKQNQDGK